MFVVPVGEGLAEYDCPRCGHPMLRVEYSDGTARDQCSLHKPHDGKVCEAVGHAGGWQDTEECPVCAAPARWVRVEVREGKAYTYLSYEEPPLEQGEWVRTPANQVQSEPFAGKVPRCARDEGAPVGAA